MTESEKIEYVAGQVHALMGFSLALINSHPSPERLSRHMDFVEHITLARTEATPVTDAYVNGVDDVHERLRRGLEMARAQQAGPSRG